MKEIEVIFAVSYSATVSVDDDVDTDSYEFSEWLVEQHQLGLIDTEQIDIDVEEIIE